MNVYGVGPPRSGTTMLARCLSVIRETHHECSDARAANARLIHRKAWLDLPVGDSDISALVPHSNEVAFWLSFAADKLDGKVIHLWRPAETWLRSALGFGMLTPAREAVWATKESGLPDLPLPEGPDDIRLQWVYREFHSRLLRLTDTYVTTPDRIVWEDLFAWLGWDVTNEQIQVVQGLQRTRPNQGAPFRGNLTIDAETLAIEHELEARTPFSREQAVHPA